MPSSLGIPFLIFIPKKFQLLPIVDKRGIQLVLGEEELPATTLAKLEDGLMEIVPGTLKLEHSIVNVPSKKGELGK